MNPRVLELIKNPKNIQSEDLNLLKEEIHAFPYMQNIRALHLYGVHLYDKENYQKELSITAAYTTDKKILYQLINGKIQQESKQASEDNKTSGTPEKTARIAYKAKGFPIKRETASEKNEEKEESGACMLQPPQEIKHIYVNGERNRILFEGEENFLDEAHPETIDIESTLESGTLVTQKPVVREEAKKEQTEENAGESFTPEIVINDEISSETKEEKINKEENISFIETESFTSETEVEEKTAEEPEEAGITVENHLPLPDQEETTEESGAELSFHGMEAFMPDVKIQANNEDVTDVAEVSRPAVNKHEEEMRRLIEEVEKKMKESRPSEARKEEEKEVSGHEISFAETQSFHFWSTGQEEYTNTGAAKAESVDVISENQEPVKEPKEEEIKEEKKEAEPELQSGWKPMSLESNTPDSLINKPVEVPIPEPQTPVQEEQRADAEEEDMNAEIIETVVESENEQETANENILPEIEEIPELVEDQSENIGASDKNGEEAKLKEDEAPVMNVSFFSTDISKWKVEQAETEEKEKEPAKQEAIQEGSTEISVQQPSNVPGFINTWQNWLKIDRTPEIEKEKAESKEKVIDAFIENNPRISQLKEESSYVVKEKNDDISHLMTETLANLYFEQKLYTKAIKAYEVLISKNPDKKEYFESKIQEIKDFRSKN